MNLRSALRLGLLLIAAMGSSIARAQTVVTLQQATATYSQPNFDVSAAIDGNTTSTTAGWAVAGNTTITNIAAFETVSDLGFGGGTLLSFTLTQASSTYVNHLLGSFRISITTDSRSTFADGLPNNGNVTANWTVLSLTSLSASSGATLTVQGDGSVLVSGTLLDTDVYVMSALTNATGITGFRLEAIPDASLPGNGPGRASGNGNFILTEFGLTATAIPEPATYTTLAGLAVLALAARRRFAR